MAIFSSQGFSGSLMTLLTGSQVLQREIASAKGIRVEQLTSLNSPSHPPSPFDVQRLAQDDGVGDHGSEYETARRSKRRYRRHPKVSLMASPESQSICHFDDNSFLMASDL